MSNTGANPERKNVQNHNQNKRLNKGHHTRTTKSISKEKHV